LRREKTSAAIAKDQYKRDIAMLQQALEDKAAELMDKHRDHGMQLNHYRTCARITNHRTMDLETRIVELDDLLSAMHINAIDDVNEPIVVEPAVNEPIIVEPIAVPLNNTLPHGYYLGRLYLYSVLRGIPCRPWTR
jgi:hypothetical protein